MSQPGSDATPGAGVSLDASAGAEPACGIRLKGIQEAGVLGLPAKDHRSRNGPGSGEAFCIVLRVEHEPPREAACLQQLRLHQHIS